jgi:uncharacterized protein (TIGR01244 family)
VIVTGCHTVGTRVNGIDNFDTVNASLYRGAQPSREGIEELKRRGVRTVVNLRDDANPDERQWADQAGMRYVVIPMSPMKVEPAKVAAFLDEMKQSPQPVFVHCRQGRDRTGLEVAVYRIVEDDWSREAALKELYAHGYHWAVFPGIARYVKTFDPKQYKGVDAVVTSPE